MNKLHDMVLLGGEKPVMLMSNWGLMFVVVGVVVVGMFVLGCRLIFSDRF